MLEPGASGWLQGGRLLAATSPLGSSAISLSPPHKGQPKPPCLQNPQVADHWSLGPTWGASPFLQLLLDRRSSLHQACQPIDPGMAPSPASLLLHSYHPQNGVLPAISSPGTTPVPWSAFCCRHGHHSCNWTTKSSIQEWLHNAMPSGLAFSSPSEPLKFLRLSSPSKCQPTYGTPSSPGTSWPSLSHPSSEVREEGSAAFHQPPLRWAPSASSWNTYSTQ